MTNANADKLWSEMDLIDLLNSLACGRTLAEIAEYLSRNLEEIEGKARELHL
jgi:hypothetical protein